MLFRFLSVINSKRIAKPIKNIDLQRNIKLTISRMADSHHQSQNVQVVELDHATPFILSDRIFVPHKEKMVKIFIEDILYIEADRNYCHIYTRKQDYLLAISLKNMEEKLTAPCFVRIHRSFVINLTQVDEVAESHVILAGRDVLQKK